LLYYSPRAIKVEKLNKNNHRTRGFYVIPTFSFSFYYLSAVLRLLLLLRLLSA
jgi:hypothetical protein